MIDDREKKRSMVNRRSHRIAVNMIDETLENNHVLPKYLNLKGSPQPTGQAHATNDIETVDHPG